MHMHTRGRTLPQSSKKSSTTSGLSVRDDLTVTRRNVATVMRVKASVNMGSSSADLGPWPKEERQTLAM